MSPAPLTASSSDIDIFNNQGIEIKNTNLNEKLLGMRPPSPILRKDGQSHSPSSSSQPLGITVEEVEMTPDEYRYYMSTISTQRSGSEHFLPDILEESEDDDEDKDSSTSTSATTSCSSFEKPEDDENDKTKGAGEDIGEDIEEKNLTKVSEDTYMTNTMRRRIIKRTPSVAVLDESETAQVTCNLIAVLSFFVCVGKNGSTASSRKGKDC